MTDTPMDWNVSHPPSGWSNRILILAVAGILFLTLHPFSFDFGRYLPRPLFPFSLGGWGQKIGPLEDFLNVLLFVPYGFGLAEKLRERGASRIATFGVTLAAGALLSYAVELLQIYIPQRDSGWEDVLTNSFGGVVGAMLFDLFGGGRLLSATEREARAWLTWRRAAPVLTLYLGIWCVFTVRLQEEARLSNWNSDSLLVVGNSASNRFTSAWKGQIFELEMWGHAVSPEFARALTSRDPADTADTDSIVAYRFSGSAPFQDGRHLLPGLSWTSQAPGSISASDVFLDGKSWLTSPSSVSALVSDLEKTGQFSLRVLCEPADISGVDARIVSISSPSGAANMELRQEDASLVFWFRTPLSMQRARMSWIIPETFAANEMRDILLTFDGASANLFINGKKHDSNYELGPGAALARIIRRIKTPELELYGYAFYAMVFFPAGCLIGLASRAVAAHGVVRLSLALSGLVLPSVILEAVLVHASGRAVSFENIVLSILLTASGSLWINADRSSLGALRNEGKLSLAR
jgi:VanZ family protein